MSVHIDEENEEEENGEEGNLNRTSLGLLWLYMIGKWEFDADKIKGEFLIRKIGTKEWTVMEDEQLDEVCSKATFAGCKGAERKKIKMLLNSHLVPKKDFIVMYLNEVKKISSSGTIDKFLDCIKTTNQPLWKKYMKKWLVGCVANVIVKDGCLNHICPILTGGQGAGKTTFIQYLMPAELKKYLFNGEFDLNTKKDCYWKLVDYWLLNIEEQIQSLNRQDANTMKALVTMPDVKGRKPYGFMDTRGCRIGNLIASTNEEGFLNDPTGSRRYPSFKIISINVEAYRKIKINDVWAESVRLFESKNFCYWVTPEDAQELKISNKQFVDASQEHELVEHYFEPVKNKKDATHVAATTFIHTFLSLESNNKQISSYRVGKAMKSLDFINDSHKGDDDLFSTKKWFFKITRTCNSMAVLDAHKYIK
jgi:predicted P-loop ATPase